MSDNDDNLVAQELFRRLSTLKPDAKSPRGWFIKGIALSEQERYDEAIQAYSKAIEINPNYAEAWVNKGYALD